jgi:peptide/nickel transport system substrate-binding protein
VTIHLTKPDPEFLHKVANALIVPVSSPFGEVTRPLPGTGPYMIKRWDSKTGLLVRNPHFRVRSPDRPDGLPDEIIFRGAPLKDQIAEVDRGASDVAVFDLNLEPKDAPARTRFGARLHTDDLPSTSFLFMNTRVSPFDDARVRRALNYAVDRGHVAKVFGSETNTPTCQLLPPGFQGSTPACPFTIGPGPGGAWTAPDLTRARRLVAASGTRGMRVEFWVMHPWDELAGYFQALLRRLGYRSKARVYNDLGVLIENAEKRPRSPHVALSGWIADSAGPSNFVTPLITCAGTFNLSHFCDRGLDAKLQDAAQASGAAAVVKWRQADAALAAESPTVPLVNQNWVAITARRVGNYQSHTFMGPLLDQLWVK